MFTIATGIKICYIINNKFRRNGGNNVNYFIF